MIITQNMNNCHEKTVYDLHENKDIIKRTLM